MPDATLSSTTAPEPALNWSALQKALGTGSIEETQRRAFEIAKFVADVENDQDSKLILKTGNSNVELNLKK